MCVLKGVLFVDDTVIMLQFAFSDGDDITEIIKDEFVDTYRTEFADDCAGCAASIAEELLCDHHVLCSCVTFKSGSSFTDSGVVVRDELHDTDRVYTHHTVLLLGACIMDVLHSNRLIKTTEYVKALLEKNPKLCIDAEMTGSWVNNEGWPVNITVERLLSGDWG